MGTSQFLVTQLIRDYSITSEQFHSYIMVYTSYFFPIFWSCIGLYWIYFNESLLTEQSAGRNVGPFWYIILTPRKNKIYNL